MIMFSSQFLKLPESNRLEIATRLNDEGYGDVTSILTKFVSVYPACPLQFLCDRERSKSPDIEFLASMKNLLGNLYDKRGQEGSNMQGVAVHFGILLGKIIVAKSVMSLGEFSRYPSQEKSRAAAAILSATVNGMVGQILQDSEESKSWCSYFWNRGLVLEPINFEIMEAHHD
jgi:hypothetical protein